jgi:hypothetical protein
MAIMDIQGEKKMYGVYFDDKIFETDKFSREERTLRLNLQRNKTARETLRELGVQSGLYANKKRESLSRRV